MPATVRYITSSLQRSRFRWEWTVTIQRDGRVTAIHDGTARSLKRAERAIREFMRQHSREDYRVDH